jgi:hypothetical protein
MPVGQAGADMYALARTLQALGYSKAGLQAYLSTIKGKQYIVLKGYAGLRDILSGTKYLASNPKIVQLGLGVKGVANVAKGGLLLGVVVTTGVEFIDWMVNDQKTFAEMLGNIGYDAVKSGVVTGLAYGAAAGMGALTSVAIAPLITFVVVIVVLGIRVNMLDNKYDVKNRVFACLKALPSNLPPGVYSAPGDMVQTLQSIQKTVQEKMQAANPVTDSMMKELHRFLDTSMRQMMRPR